jgi:ribulose 1,5-bisphosphate synthetase/thiazole synthase
MVYSIVFLLCTTLAIRLEDVHDVIIIGAGIAGIGASKKLTDYSVPHLIL